MKTNITQIIYIYIYSKNPIIRPKQDCGRLTEDNRERQRISKGDIPVKSAEQQKIKQIYYEKKMLFYYYKTFAY